MKVITVSLEQSGRTTGAHGCLPLAATRVVENQAHGRERGGAMNDSSKWLGDIGGIAEVQRTPDQLADRAGDHEESNESAQNLPEDGVTNGR